MGDEEEDIDKEAQQAAEEVNQADDEDHQEVPRRVRRRMEVSNDGQNKHDQCDKGSHGVNNQNGRESCSSSRWKIEIVGFSWGEAYRYLVNRPDNNTGPNSRAS